VQRLLQRVVKARECWLDCLWGEGLRLRELASRKESDTRPSGRSQRDGRRHGTQRGTGERKQVSPRMLRLKIDRRYNRRLDLGLQNTPRSTTYTIDQTNAQKGCIVRWHQEQSVSSSNRELRDPQAFPHRSRAALLEVLCPRRDPPEHEQYFLHF